MTIDSLDTWCATWPHAAPRERVERHEVAVFTAALRADPDTFAHALITLDSAERERFERHQNSAVAHQFVVGRLRLREVLGAVIGVAPAELPIQIGVHGKPALGHAAQATGVRFSVAHCDDLLVIALSRAGDVGVDVERIRPIERWARVAERVFSAADREALASEIARGRETEVEFFRHWCRTEAELKAIGCGIAGLPAHRSGWRPPGFRIAELPELPLPVELRGGAARYQSAVAICAPRDASTCQIAWDASQAMAASSTPARASTA